MAIYYITIFVFVFIGVYYDKLARNNLSTNGLIYLSIFFFSIIYGFRFEVGVDWGNYINAYNRHIDDGRKIFEFTTLEIGYKALNAIAYYVDQGIVTVIFISTFLFITFTLLALKKLGLNPFYFFSIVAPYHFVMSGLNYTRQGVALSIFIYAVSCLVNRERYKFLFYILLASSFHTSAFCFAPLFLIENKKRYMVIPLLLVLPPLIQSMLVEYRQYLEGSMDSAGLYLRALYLIGPTLLILLHLNSLKLLTLIERRLTCLVLISFPLIFILSSLSSTIADRFSYYFILLNTVIWMLVSKQSSYVQYRHLMFYGNFLLFLSSLLAFIIWTLYTRYINYYEFDSYFNHWLS